MVVRAGSRINKIHHRAVQVDLSMAQQSGNCSRNMPQGRNTRIRYEILQTSCPLSFRECSPERTCTDCARAHEARDFNIYISQTPDLNSP